MRDTLLLAILVLLIVAVTARGEDAATETWDRLDMAGAPAGWVRTTTRRLAGDRPDVETTVRTELHLMRMGQTTDVVNTERTVESADGALVRIERTSKMSANESTTVCTFADGKVTIATTLMGKTRTVEKPLPPGVVGPFQTGKRTASLAGTSGTTLDVLTFMLDFQGAVRTTTVSKGKETVKLADGKTAELTRLESKFGTDAGAPVPMTTVAWIDAVGDALRTTTTMGGISFESWRVPDEATAKGGGASAASTPDVFAATVIQENGFLPVPRRLEEATIVVKKRRPEADVSGVADAGHVVTQRDDGSIRIRASQRTPAADKQGVRPLLKVPAELADALASSSMIQADAPEIAAVVKEVVGAETNAWKSAQTLERWVHDAVTEKNMNVAFASALEVCKSREGDCTEHAVLLAALCRAAGIPARILMGVEYVGGIWGGHAWNEVWIEGAWYPLDATNGLGFVDPLHLPMARMTMKEGDSSEYVQLLGSLGTIDLDVVEAVRAGRRIAVDDASLVTMDKGLYANRVLGIAFRAPEGWEFDAPKMKPEIRFKVMEIDGRTASGKKAEIEIDMLDAPAQPDWDRLLREFRFDPTQAKAVEVDGRASRRVTRARGDRSDIHVATIADGALWIFKLDRADGETASAAFDAFLASVDFDVK